MTDLTTDKTTMRCIEQVGVRTGQTQNVVESEAIHFHPMNRATKRQVIEERDGVIAMRIHDLKKLGLILPQRVNPPYNPFSNSHQISAIMILTRSRKHVGHCPPIELKTTLAKQ